MSTGALLCKKMKGYYKCICCHFEGYPTYMLNTLNTYYSNEEQVNKLLSYGNASYIGSLLEPTKPGHTFNTPQEDVCIFYIRDRGDKQYEQGCGRLSLKRIKQNNNDYIYIYKEGKWEVMYR